MLLAWRAVRTNILDTTNIVNFSRIVKMNTKKIILHFMYIFSVPIEKKWNGSYIHNWFKWKIISVFILYSSYLSLCLCLYISVGLYKTHSVYTKPTGFYTSLSIIKIYIKKYSLLLQNDKI